MTTVQHPSRQPHAAAQAQTPGQPDAPDQPDAVDHAQADPAALGPLSADALEMSELLLQLIHVASMRRPEESGATAPGTPGDAGRAARGDAGRGAHAGAPGGGAHGAPAGASGIPGGNLSNHAVRAAIHVYQHGQRTIGELAAGLGVSYGWASRVAAELERAGMVDRMDDPADRRIVRVALTAAAIDAVEAVYRWRGDAIERAMAPLDPDGRAAVRQFLRAAIAELGAGPGR